MVVIAVLEDKFSLLPKHFVNCTAHIFGKTHDVPKNLNVLKDSKRQPRSQGLFLNWEGKRP